MLLRPRDAVFFQDACQTSGGDLTLAFLGFRHAISPWNNHTEAVV
jgi:hypothetical protein